MFKEPLLSWLSSSVIGRAHRQGILASEVVSILEHVGFNHHAADDTPYGGGPGELLRIDIIEPLIRKALDKNLNTPRQKKRVLLMDPAGEVFSHQHAQRLSRFDELIFVCGRYEGIDARIHHYVDEAVSLGDFVLSSGDLAAMAIFDAAARMIEGVLGNQHSIVQESHAQGRLEASLYTRPKSYDGFVVPEIYCAGHHQEIQKAKEQESLVRTQVVRPDLLEKYPLSGHEQAMLHKALEQKDRFPWMKSHE